MKLLRKRFQVFIIISLFMLIGCRGNMQTPYHVSNDVDFSFIKNVAVLPLENLSNEKAAGEIMRRLVISELLASGLVNVVVPGEVMAAVKDLGIKNFTSLDRNQIKELGRVLRIQGIVMGSIDQYGYVRIGSGTAPEVTLSLMMADTGTGDIIWSVTQRKGGEGFLSRHFGATSQTLSETSLSAVREAIGTLTDY
jgi:hypothetical protein